MPCLFRYGYCYCAVCQLGGELVASLKSLGTFLHLPRFAQQAVQGGDLFALLAKLTLYKRTRKAV